MYILLCGKKNIKELVSKEFFNDSPEYIYKINASFDAKELSYSI